MLECSRFLKQKSLLITRITTAVFVILGIVLLLAQTAFAQNTYLINDGDNVLVHTTYATDPAEILIEAGLQLGEDDTFTTSNDHGVSEITINRKQVITIYHNNKTLYVNSYGETVGALLNRLNILLGADDIVSLPLDTATYNGMALNIAQAIERQETYTELIPYETTYCYDATLQEGQEVVLTAGVNGQQLCSATVSYVNGAEINRVIHSQTVISQPTNAVIATGTYQEALAPAPSQPAPPAASLKGMPVEYDGYIVTADGETLTFTQKLTSCKGTAYSCDGKPGITYTGTPARVGAIAVDPTVIPLNSRLYVVTEDGDFIYGLCTAEDIGGSVKGPWVDLYFNTIAECYQFGLRSCTVYILG